MYDFVQYGADMRNGMIKIDISLRIMVCGGLLHEPQMAHSMRYVAVVLAYF